MSNDRLDTFDHRELDALRRELDEFIEYFPTAFVEFDLATLRVQRMSRMARTIFGFTSEDIAAGIHAPGLITPTDVARFYDVHERLAGESLRQRTPYERRRYSEVLEVTLIRKDGSTLPGEVETAYVLDDDEVPCGVRCVFRDISDRKRVEAEREALLTELQQTVAEVRELSGLLPICAWCKRVRSDDGYWGELEHYIRQHSGADFSHGICPECAEAYGGEARRPED